MTATEPDVLTTTRRCLHGVAELLLAGPQWRTSQDIRLRVTGDGFATVSAPDLRLDGTELVAGDRRFALHGRTSADVAADAGVEAGEPAGVYGEGPGVRTDEVLTLDAEATETITRALRDGDEALRAFAPEQEPVLWPEHFDIGITVDEVNYGVSPGDSYIAQPYAYVGPHTPRQDEFFNAPFGAARPITAFVDAEAIVRFFAEGKRHAAL